MSRPEHKDHGLKPDFDKKKPESYDLLYAGINLKEEIGGSGVRLCIPTFFLHGRQEKSEYSGKKRRQVEYALKTEGVDFLLKNPVIVCAIQLGGQLLLTIIDGHHRNRYAGLYGIKDIPCIVVDTPTIVNVINRHNKHGEKQLTVVGFETQLKNEVAIAIGSFGSSFLDSKKPRLAPFPTITDLGVSLPSF